MKHINEFLDLLEEELRYLNPKDASEVLKHYQEKINVMIDYGETEGKIIASLPTPSKIASDIYASKGINYIEKRKKTMKKQSIIKAIFSCLILVLLLSGFFTITYFLGNSIVNLVKLAIKSFGLKNLLDIISLFLFNITYIFTLLICYVYIFDLLYYMASFSIENIINAFSTKNKEYKFLDFTISDFIEKKLKKEKILFKILISSAICLLFFGIGNFATKGYIYRSVNNQIEVAEEIKLNTEVNEIIIEESSVFVVIKIDNTLSYPVIKYGNEFNNTLDYVVNEGKMTIKGIVPGVFDLFGILDETLPKLEIYLPNKTLVETIDMKIYDGIIDIIDVTNVKSFKLDLNNTTFALTKCNIQDLNIVSNSSTLALEENTILKTDINLVNGNYYSVKDIYQEFVLNNNLASIVFKNTIVEEGTITNSSAKVAMDSVTFNKVSYKDVASESYFTNSKFYNIAFSSINSSDIAVDKSVVIEKMKLISTNGVFDLFEIKVLDFEIQNESGTIVLNNINTIDTLGTNLLVTSNNGKIEMLKTYIENALFNITDTTVIINNNVIKNTNVILNNAQLNITDLDGTSMNVDVHGGSLSFYNDNIKSDIVLTITGETIKTAIDIDNNIKTIKETGGND